MWQDLVCRSRGLNSHTFNILCLAVFWRFEKFCVYIYEIRIICSIFDSAVLITKNFSYFAKQRMLSFLCFSMIIFGLQAMQSGNLHIFGQKWLIAWSKPFAAFLYDVRFCTCLLTSSLDHWTIWRHMMQCILLFASFSFQFQFNLTVQSFSMSFKEYFPSHPPLSLFYIVVLKLY